MVRSQFNFKPYISLFAGVVFFSWGYQMVTHPEVHLPHKTDNVLLPGIFFVVVSVILIASFLFMARITIGPDSLVPKYFFIRRRIAGSDIERIDLFHMRKRRVFFHTGDEAILIQTKSGRNYRIDAQYYRNMPDLKRTLLRLYGEFIPVSSLRLPENAVGAGSSIGAQAAGDKIYSPHFLKSGMGIGMALLSLIVLIVFVLGMGVWLKRPALLLIPFVPWLMFYFVLGSAGFYFQIAGGCLEVRNHLWSWYRRSYRLEEIDSVVLYTQKSKGLRVRKFSFEMAGYPATILRDRDWNELKAALQQRNIVVIDEQDRYRS